MTGRNPDEVVKLPLTEMQGLLRPTVLLQAERIAGELGINEVHAEVLQAQKVEIVRHLQTQGFCVVFVGDGVNDASALATANVGVA